MSLSIAESVAKLLGRPLTSEEATGLANFKNYYEIDESDPIALVLALVGANTVLINSMPNLLQQKADETIELHRRTLMDQSTIIAKELIATLSQNIANTNASLKVRGMWFFGGAGCGAVAAITILKLFWKL